MRSITTQSTIESIADQVRLHINDKWEVIFNEHLAKLSKAYQELGDGAYGLYLDLLFKPIYKQLKNSNFQVLPKLPGNLNSSREWGTADETDQQRWMWSVLKHTNGSDCGTLVVEVFHDHTQFRLPRKPAIRSLIVTEQEEVIAELSRISPEFARAKDMKAEYADYLLSLDKKRTE